MTIRLNLKRTSGKITTIRAIVRQNGAKMTVSTGVKVEIKDWDRKRERSKTNNQTNQQLDEIKNNIRQFWDNNKRMPTKNELSNKTSNPILQTIINHGLNVIQATGRKNTLKAYSTLATNIRKFSTEKNRTETNTSDISEEYIRSFQNWMKEKGFAQGHLGKMMRTLKTVTKPNNEKVWTKIKPVKTTQNETIYLTNEEIELFQNAELPTNLKKVRDLFIIGYYTGQRYSDWAKIKLKSIEIINGKKVLTINQTKTNNQTTMPINQKTSQILQEEHSIISNQKMNKYLKKIAKIAGIKPEKAEKITTHTARRSFATNALLAGIPITEIMKIGGWKSISAFSNYIKTSNIETALKYANHPFFD